MRAKPANSSLFERRNVTRVNNRPRCSNGLVHRSTASSYIIRISLVLSIYTIHQFTIIPALVTHLQQGHPHNKEKRPQSEMIKLDSTRIPVGNDIISIHNTTSPYARRVQSHFFNTPPTPKSNLVEATRRESIEATDEASQDSSMEHIPRAAIVTKIHGPAFVPQLVQSMCLLKSAYNHRARHDVIVFTTEPLSDEDMAQLQDVIFPAKFQLVVDDKTLQDHIGEMTSDQVANLLTRCNKTLPDQLAWGTRCCEKGTTSCMPLSYTWQCEFRALHIWASPHLAPYRYMMWVDSDAMATKVWEQDPVAFAVQHQLKILFAGIQGKTKGRDVQKKIMRAYNQTLCGLRVVEGHLHGTSGRTCIKYSDVRQIHGYFHITDLDFYRLPENLQWFRVMIGNEKFSRRWDDQLAITVPAAILAPDKSWEMEPTFQGLTGIFVYHNRFVMDLRSTNSSAKTSQRARREKWTGGGFQSYWRKIASQQFPEARECLSLIRNAG